MAKTPLSAEEEAALLRDALRAVGHGEAALALLGPPCTTSEPDPQALAVARTMLDLTGRAASADRLEAEREHARAGFEAEKGDARLREVSRRLGFVEPGRKGKRYDSVRVTFAYLSALCDGTSPGGALVRIARDFEFASPNAARTYLIKRREEMRKNPRSEMATFVRAWLRVSRPCRGEEQIRLFTIPKPRS